MREIAVEKQIALKPSKHTGNIWQKRLPALLILGTLLLNLKRAVAHFDIDVEYAITMSYRLAMGDHMFSQMREPHQTSAFLLAFFVKIWVSVLGTTTGLVLYLNAISLLVKLAVVLFFYKTCRRYCTSETAFCMALFLGAVQAKEYILLDFSNMHMYSSILLFCCLLRYLECQQNKVWLIFSALCMCLEVLSYPSCLFVFFLTVGLLYTMAERRVKDCMLFSAICGGVGVSYITFFGVRLGWHNFIFYISEILAGDSSHSDGLFVKFSRYGREGAQLLLFYGILLILSLVISLLAKRLFPAKRGIFCISFCMLSALFNLWSIITVNCTFRQVEFYTPLIIAGICLFPRCSRPEKRVFRIGITLSIGSLLAVLMLTNLTLNTSSAYLILGVAVSFIPIGYRLLDLFGNIRIPFTLLMFLLFFKGVFLFQGMDQQNQLIFSLNNIVKAGPAIGIVSNYMGPYIMNSDIEEWPHHIQPKDRVLVVSEPEVGTLRYLYEDVEISAASTICTPTYDEKLLQYWEENPDKLPNVVVVNCWFGNLNVDEDSWIMQWIYEEFGADSYEDGKYERYYRRPDTE